MGGHFVVALASAAVLTKEREEGERGTRSRQAARFSRGEKMFVCVCVVGPAAFSRVQGQAGRPLSDFADPSLHTPTPFHFWQRERREWSLFVNSAVFWGP